MIGWGGGVWGDADQDAKHFIVIPAVHAHAFIFIIPPLDPLGCWHTGYRPSDVSIRKQKAYVYYIIYKKKTRAK